jgi:hypothetical protein
MKKIINICDFYKKPITMPIESEYRYSTVLGFITTLLTFITFALHFYFESYELLIENTQMYSPIKTMHMLTTSQPLKCQTKH